VREAERGRHTLVAVGASGLGGRRRLVEGSVPTEILRRAPCSVLVARQADDAFPRRIVVGVDGSPASALACAAARSLAARFGADIEELVALGGRLIDDLLVAAISDGCHASPAPPSAALLEAAGDADLVVVGGRGLHGFRSLGSVAERVALGAPCSALVVR
jgi:nucleotide-binding universal stress UspA family protein